MTNDSSLDPSLVEMEAVDSTGDKVWKVSGRLYDRELTAARRVSGRLYDRELTADRELVGSSTERRDRDRLFGRETCLTAPCF
jgi:hypothetical protein